MKSAARASNENKVYLDETAKRSALGAVRPHMTISNARVEKPNTASQKDMRSASPRRTVRMTAAPAIPKTATPARNDRMGAEKTEAPRSIRKYLQATSGW